MLLWNVENITDFSEGEGIFHGELTNGQLNNDIYMPNFTNPSLDWETADFSLTNDDTLSNDPTFTYTPKSKESFYSSIGAPIGSDG